MKNIQIKEKTLSLIAKINEKNPYYLVIGVLIAALLLDYFLIMRFQLIALAAIGPRRCEIEDHFREFETNVSRVDKYRQDILRINDRLDALESRIRTAEEVPSVLEELSMAANRHKILIVQTSPATGLGQPVLKNAEGLYYLMPIEIEARGGYHDFGRFLNELEDAGALMNVSQLMITANTDNPRLHTIRLGVKAFIFDPAGRKR